MKRVARLKHFALAATLALATTPALFAQTGTVQGTVIGQDGQPLKGAQIVIEREDMHGHYPTKTDKKGKYLYLGVPFGTYTISVIVNGQTMDKMQHVKVQIEGATQDFNLQQTAQKNAALNQQLQSGQAPSADQEKGMSKEEREQFEKQAKEAQEKMKKNKALNDAFSAGMAAMNKAQADTDKSAKVADYNTAVTSFNQAKDLDATQIAIWEQLGEAEYQLGKLQMGDEKAKSLDAAADAYNHAATLDPNNPNIYLQLENIDALAGKLPEAEQAMTKAAQLNPQVAAKAYFNMGATLVNTGHGDKAAEYFKKATDSDPNYAEAWYQYSVAMVSQGTLDAKTGQQIYPEGTLEGFQKYLQLQPNGPHASEAQQMIDGLKAQVQTETKVKGKK